MRIRMLWAVVVLALAVGLIVLGCEDDQKRHRQEMDRQRQELLQKAEQERRVLEARKKEAEDDSLAAMMVVAACGMALWIVITILCRERQLRRDGSTHDDSTVRLRFLKIVITHKHRSSCGER